MKTNWPAFRCGCLILAGAMLGVVPASVHGQESAGTNASAAVISSVAVTQDQQRAAVRVEGAGHLDVHASRIGNPERLVLDFAGARLGMHVQRTSIPGVSAPVRAVRLGQFRPDIARVVIDLTASAPYQIEHEGSAIVVYLEAVGQPASAHYGADDRERDFAERESSSAEQPGREIYERNGSSLPVAERTDPALSRPGSAEREERTSAARSKLSAGGAAGCATSDHGGHDGGSAAGRRSGVAGADSA